jgi:glycosyltransferase involved in cell wall biosynthesis
MRTVPAVRPAERDWDAPGGGAPVAFVTPADCRFPNMAVNQRLRAMLDRADVEVVSCHPRSFPPDLAGRARIRSFPVSRRLRAQVPKLAAFSVEVALWSAWQRLRGRRYRLVYTFQDTSAVAGMILCGRRRGRGWVLDVLDDPGQELANAVEGGRPAKAAMLRVRDRVFRALAGGADLAFTIGSDPADPLPEILRRDYGMAGERIVPLHQAIDVAGTRARFETTFPADRAVVLFVGYVSPLRGVDTLIEAGRRVRAHGLPVEVHLVGHLKEADRPWLESAVAAQPGLVAYHGMLPSEEALRRMAACSVGVLPFPARREMLPVQAVTGTEYLSLGKPLVATDLPGARALVADGENGWLVPPGDAGAMAEAIARFARDPGLAARMGERSAAAAQGFDVAAVDRRIGAALAEWL